MFEASQKGEKMAKTILQPNEEVVTDMQAQGKSKAKLYFRKLKRDVCRDKLLYFMIVPGFVILLIFAYLPMYGIILAFKNYSPVHGILGSPFMDPWYENFYIALTSSGFWKLVRNTLILGILKMVFAFPAPIVLALMFNELKNGWFKKTVQTISYLPYFISWVIINAIVYMFLATDYGFLNKFLEMMGLNPIQWYASPEHWRFILTFTYIWRNIGWGTITFLAAIAAVSPDLYEAAEIDGASRWKQVTHITLPGIMPVVGITFVLSLSKIFQDDFEQIYALVGSNSELYETAEVIGSWSYRTFRASFKGWGYTQAVGLLQSVMSLILVLIGNHIVRKSGNVSLY